MEKAVVGGGCFWCTEAVFQRVEGVEKVVPGYAGGDTENPTYREVCSGKTGHAEVIEITFNPDVVSYAEILEIFFKTHDPTQLNRQGADVGTQYRSIILHTSEDQRDTAKRVKEELNRSDIWDDEIVTEIAPLETFYEAEDEHHNYFNDNRRQPYCQFVVAPKVSKLEQLFEDKLK